jgi:hypothetical protein
MNRNNIRAFINLPLTFDKSWALGELQSFRERVLTFSIDDEICYSRTYEDATEDWYNYIHEKLNEYNFVNGKPEEDTWEKRPRAAFWWCLYCTTPHNRCSHHCSSKELREGMLSIIDEATKYLK